MKPLRHTFEEDSNLHVQTFILKMLSLLCKDQGGRPVKLNQLLLIREMEKEGFLP